MFRIDKSEEEEDEECRHIVDTWLVLLSSSPSVCVCPILVYSLTNKQQTKSMFTYCRLVKGVI